MLYDLKYNSGSIRVKELVVDIEKIVYEYGWADEVVHPWAGCPMKISKIIRDLKDYPMCTDGTKEYLIDLANGLVRILNHWVEYEKSGVWVRVLASGRMAKVERDFADELIKSGMCEEVKG